MNNDLLIEIGCEDLPARYVLPLAQALSAGVAEGLAKRGIATGAARHFATPRRIAVLVQAVAARQAEQSVERFGPALAAAFRDGTATAAAEGFAKSCGVSVGNLKEKNGKLYFASTTPGRASAELIPEIFADTLKQMDTLIPKRMRWGSGEETFVRPVQWLLCLLDGKAIPLKRFGLVAANKTFGHRFHAPKAILLKSPADYETKLRAAKVWADFDSRRNEIRAQAETEAAKLKGKARITDSLLQEVTALVEWPVALSGRIDARFMALPADVIVTTIEHNQRYFPVLSKTGKLLPCFITIANIKSRDKTKLVSGNERVVRPRLADALFFWQQDLVKPLSDYVPALEAVSFQQKLGTIGDKCRRIAAISAIIVEHLELDKAASTTIARAAALCKADLVTRMVIEFPELQGVIGGYYAKSCGETDVVAQAISEHYRPIQAGTEIPASLAGCVVSLADKLDTLAGIFAIGQKPSASKDPFALRRAALGVLRILIEGRLSLNLRALLSTAVSLQPLRGKDAQADQTLADEILGFAAERLRAYYTDREIPVEVFEAVFATGTEMPLDFDARVAAVQAFLKLPQAQQLSAAHKRVRNILRQAAAGFDSSPPDAALLYKPAEKQLHLELLSLGNELPAQVQSGQYRQALTRLASLQAPIDRFFAEVMVMDENPAIRNNRLKLLAGFDEQCRAVADISRLPG